MCFLKNKNKNYETNVKLSPVKSRKKPNTEQEEFQNFYDKYEILFPKNKKISKDWLHWFIGFSEGDGSFIIDNRNNLQFVITQSTEDIIILHYIKETLGFGTVIKQGLRTSRYVVQDLTNLYLIILLFNGNIVLPTRKKNFNLFLDIFNKKIIKGSTRNNIFNTLSENKTPASCPAEVEFKFKDNLPSINDSWLSGFTDAEGCFTVSFLKESNAFRLR